MLLYAESEQWKAANAAQKFQQLRPKENQYGLLDSVFGTSDGCHDVFPNPSGDYLLDANRSVERSNTRVVVPAESCCTDARNAA
jgi:hypothetical protein